MNTKEKLLRSQAEVLFCLDYLMHHLNDEDSQDNWFRQGIPDGLYEGVSKLTDKQLKPYLDLLTWRDNDNAFNYFVKVAVRLMHKECFREEYVPGVFW